MCSDRWSRGGGDGMFPKLRSPLYAGKRKNWGTRWTGWWWKNCEKEEHRSTRWEQFTSIGIILWGVERNWWTYFVDSFINSFILYPNIYCSPRGGSRLIVSYLFANISRSVAPRWKMNRTDSKALKISYKNCNDNFSRRIDRSKDTTLRRGEKAVDYSFVCWYVCRCYYLFI